MLCGARAERTYEGLEDDLYQCESGHSFGIDWSHGSPPDQPQWPPSPEALAQIEMIRKLREGLR